MPVCTVCATDYDKEAFLKPDGSLFKRCTYCRIKVRDIARIARAKKQALAAASREPESSTQSSTDQRVHPSIR